MPDPRRTTTTLGGASRANGHEPTVPPGPGAPPTASEPAELGSLLASLRAHVRALGSVVLGLSGGVDSALLARVCHDELGPRALAVIARSPSLPERELAAARALTARIGIACREVDTDELADPGYVGNTGDRCYFCKHELFTHLERIAGDEGYGAIAYGENADDAGDHRPGRRAATEMHVRAPLREAGLGKDDVRALARWLALPVWDKPAFACLASRIPVGREVTAERLGEVEQAEAALWDLGFDLRLRVRHHDEIARIEVPPEQIAEVAARADEVVPAVEAAGFRHVTLDLGGYRRGGGIERATTGATRGATTGATTHLPIVEAR